jgi:hypothetical protein
MRQYLDPAREWREAWLLADDKLAAYAEPALPKPVACPFTPDQLLDEAFDVADAVDRVAALLRAGDGAHDNGT